MTPKIPSRDEPSTDDASIKEDANISSANADTGKEKPQMRKQLTNWFIKNYYILYGVVILSGLDVSMNQIQYSLDSWVIVSLIGGITGSSLVYVWKRMADFAYNEGEQKHDSDSKISDFRKRISNLKKN